MKADALNRARSRQRIYLTTFAVWLVAFVISVRIASDLAMLLSLFMVAAAGAASWFEAESIAGTSRRKGLADSSSFLGRLDNLFILDVMLSRSSGDAAADTVVRNVRIAILGCLLAAAAGFLV